METDPHISSSPNAVRAKPQLPRAISSSHWLWRVVEAKRQSEGQKVWPSRNGGMNRERAGRVDRKG
jgi:hypothetical protein